jgi:hypothetical protein
METKMYNEVEKYPIDRKEFLSYYRSRIDAMTEQSVVMDDLVKGSEFILTAEDVLHSVERISPHFVGGRINVKGTDCYLYYSTDINKKS